MHMRHQNQPATATGSGTRCWKESVGRFSGMEHGLVPQPRQKIQRLLDAVKAATEQAALEDTSIVDLYIEKNNLIREEKIESDVLPVYQCAVLPQEVAYKELHLHPVGKLLGWIEEVVIIESPVHFEETARRIVEAAGVTKMGSRIRQVLRQAPTFAEKSGKIKIRGEFLWSPAMEVPVVRERSSLPSSSRKLQYISLEELCLALQKVVENAIAIHPDAGVPYVAKLLGFNRVTEEMRKDILKIVSMSMEQGLVVKDGEVLRVP